VSLLRYLSAGLAARPDHAAVEEPGRGRLSYRELASLSDRLRDRLVALGVRPGDRVGICLPKSIDAVAAIFGIQKAGAAHVPVDSSGPVLRNAVMLADCGVVAVLVEWRLEAALRAALVAQGHASHLIVLDAAEDTPLASALDGLPARRTASVERAAGDLAYVLYTSGSTGRPKGVMVSHGAALAFVDWCAATFDPGPDERFASHAPFHFDLSVLDLYLPLARGATLVLVDPEVGRDPRRLASFIASARITSWYSAPSILGLLADRGNLGAHDLGALRRILFAGEVFPVARLRALWREVPHARYWNLYGPTETNVCTAYEVHGPIPDDRTAPYPIGCALDHYHTRVVDPADPAGREVSPEAEGELLVSGSGVMLGYWNRPDETARAFLVDPKGTRWYRTGDRVVAEPGHGYRYVGRLDRMVKRRGHRVELGEVEAALVAHPEVREAAVVALPDDDGVRLVAHLATRDERGRLSIIDLKRYCGERLPASMVPDAFRFHASLPRTSTGKTDLVALSQAGD